uniref:Ectonucleotide pyrophosphatase/phosphodiesterase 7 n=1 Tax=Hucho hucho TaxID=62062 RepID=A0A4W5RHJ2_9TELE
MYYVMLCLLLAASSSGVPLDRYSTKGQHKVLLISFDGFRWDYDRNVDTPNLDTMAKDGVKARYVTPPYLTITSPTHFTLLTGTYCRSIPSEKLPYYATQFKNEWAGSLHFPGTQSTYQGETQTTKWKENVEKMMSTWFSEMDLDFVSLYFGEPDSTGHKYGPDSPERREMVKQVDRTVGYIRSLAEQNGLADSLNIIITADHGMSNVYRNGLVKEITLSRIPGFAFRDIAFHLVDFGPSGMLLPKKGMLDKVYDALKGAHPHLHVFKKEEMPKRLHFATASYPSFSSLTLDMSSTGWVHMQFNAGEHGFDNEEMDMKPFFRAVGPACQKNLEVGPFETVNIYPLMCHILGIKPDPNCGHLDGQRPMFCMLAELRIDLNLFQVLLLIVVSGILTLQRPSWITWYR